MKAKILKDFILSIRENTIKGDSWLDSIPSEIQFSYFDNPYVMSIERNLMLTMQLALGELYEDVSWFLYEWNPNHGKITMRDGTEYNILGLDDYLQYLITEGLVDA